MARRVRLRTAWALATAAACLLPAVASAQDSPPTADQQAAQALHPPVLNNPTTITIRPGLTTLKLDPSRDYRLRIKPAAPLNRGVIVQGGHNVVLEPGTLQYARPVGSKPSWVTRGLYLKGQTGTMYVSGLVVRGPLNEGIDLDQRARGATVVLKDVSIGLVTGSQSGHHADLLQTWAGPSRLVVQGFAGASTYQGFFLKPNQDFDGPRPELFWMKDVQLDLSHGYYGLWTDGWGAFPVRVQATSVTVNRARPSRDQFLWPKPSTGDRTWTAVTAR